MKTPSDILTVEQSSRRNFLGRSALLAAALPVGMTFTGSALAQSPMTKLRIGYIPATSVGLFWLGKDKGWFEKAGLDIEFTLFQSGPPVLEAMVGGSLDVGLLGSVPPLGAAARKVAPFRVISACADAINLFAVVGDPAITSVQGLKGKKVAVTSATNFEFFFEKAMKAAGVNSAEISKVNMEPVDGQAAYVAGAVDAVVPLATSQPLIFKARPNSRHILKAQDIPEATRPSILDVVLTRQEVIDRNKDALKRLLQVFHGQVIPYLASQPEAAIEDLLRWQTTIAKATLTREAMETIVKGYSYFDIAGAKALFASGKAKQSMTDQAEFLVAAKRIADMPDMDALVDASILKML